MYHKDLPMWQWRAMQQRNEEQRAWQLTTEDMEVIERLAGKKAHLIQHMTLLAKQHGNSSCLIAFRAINQAKKA